MALKPVLAERAVAGLRAVTREPSWLTLKELGSLQMTHGTQTGRAAHVSAASGLVKVAGRWWVASDDENQLAVFTRLSGKGEWVPALAEALPAEKEARRKVKADFEVLVPMSGGVFAMGSGSSPARMRGVFVPVGADGRPGAAKVVDLSGLLTTLSKRIDELNIEGAVVVGDTLRLLHRGGEAGGNALIDVELGSITRVLDGHPLVPNVKAITLVELGTLGGVPLGFSDACALPDGSLVFTASAEATDNPIFDGAVTGSIVGVMRPDGTIAATFPVKQLKLEGVHAEVVGADLQLTLVADADDPAIASPVLRAVLSGLAVVKADPRPMTDALEVERTSRTDFKPQDFVDTVRSSTDSGLGWKTTSEGQAAADGQTDE